MNKRLPSIGGFFCIHTIQIHNFSGIQKLWNQSNIAIPTLNKENMKLLITVNKK